MKTLKHPSYTYRKGGVYYFSNAVPQDLADFYAKPRIVKSLRTKSQSHARTASRSLSAKLEDYWLGLRLQKIDIPQILIAKDKLILKEIIIQLLDKHWIYI